MTDQTKPPPRIPTPALRAQRAEETSRRATELLEAERAKVAARTARLKAQRLARDAAETSRKKSEA